MKENLTDILTDRFKIERDRQDRSGIYALTQRRLAFNSNRIEGSTLTEKQTLTLFETGKLPASDDVYRAKDVEEMQGHFLMFNRMLDTLDEPLSEEMIKLFHKELKSGVFEDRANGYAIGDYKARPNRVGMFSTVSPADVPKAMGELLKWYQKAMKASSEPMACEGCTAIQDRTKTQLSILAEFHAQYESIHPFQDGNGRTGRIILFRECLVNSVVPFIIQDKNREKYQEALIEYRNRESVDALTALFIEEQEAYLEECCYFFPELK